MKKFIFYLPRVITAILVIAYFWIIIASSVIEGFNLTPFLWFMLAGIIFLALTICAWKFPKIGGIIFILLAIAAIILMIVMPMRNGIFDIKPILGIGLPILISGILFLIEGVSHD